MDALPLIVLGGSDRAPAPVTEHNRSLHPLTAYKGAALRVGDRPYLRVIADRLRAAGGWGPIGVAGPAHVYAGLDEALEIVDTDGSVGANLRAAVEHHLRRGGGALALMADDVLPRAEELTRLRAAYEEAHPQALWFPLVREPEDPEALGAHGWKPKYPIRPEPGQDPVSVLPGHLAVFDPEALRLPLLYELLDSAYRARNRSIAAKRRTILSAVLVGLLRTDARLLLGGRPPTRTASVLANGLGVARALLAKRLTFADLERAVSHIVVRRSYRRRHPTGGVRLPLVDILSLAEDVDTAEEARQHEVK